MATATIEQVETKFEILPLTHIAPSRMNPRKRFDDKALKELAESIRSHGVQQAIVVRPTPKAMNNYEIVVGERRYRASKLAGRTDIPCLIRELSDSAALEIMVIENLQREDVHPFDEALGYEALMKKAADVDPELGELPGSPKHTAQSIAAKVGKSVEYVYARLKLLALCPAAREAFEADRITAGHAVLVARLQPLDQILALRAIFEVYGDDREIRKLEPAKLAKLKLADVCADEYAAIIPEKALREWIQENVNLRLKDVPWDLDDAELLPAAGACSTCPKRSVSNPALFAELAVKNEDTCFDAACYKNKRDAFVAITIQTDRALARMSEKQGGELKEPLVKLSEMHAYTKAKPDQAIYRAGQWLPAKPGSCESTRKGILVRGEDAGQQKSVCIDPSCKVHKHGLHSASSNGGSSRETDYEEDNFKRYRAQVTERKRARARGVLCQAVVKQVGAKMPTQLSREIAFSFLDERQGEPEIVSWLLGEKKPLDTKQLLAAVAKAEGARLNQIVIALLLKDALISWRSSDAKDRESLTALAKSIGIKDARVILTGADVEIAKQQACRACGCIEEVPCSYYANGKHGTCSWKEDDLCSNPACSTHDAKVKAKKAKAGK